MITKEQITEILFNHSSYLDNSLGNIITEEKHDSIADEILSKLSQHDVSGEFTAFRKLVKRRIGSEIFKEIEEEVKAVNLR
jgi:hypothetical protein